MAETASASESSYTSPSSPTVSSISREGSASPKPATAGTSNQHDKNKKKSSSKDKNGKASTAVGFRAGSMVDDAILAASAGRRDTFAVENKSWKLSRLRKDFAIHDMEPKYQRYQQRLQHSQFVVYLLMQSIFSFVSIIISVVYSETEWEHGIRHAVTHAAVSLVSVSLMVYIYREQSFKDRPYLHFLASAIVFVTLESMQGIFLFLRPNDESELLQDWSFYTVVVCYIFLPLPTKLQAAVLGLIVTLVQLVFIFADQHYFHGSHAVERLIADVLLLICANSLGLYYRIMFEIAIRRSFLDKRASIYQTLRLNREKKKEENLLKSILPKHLSEAVKADLRKQSFLNGGSEVSSSPTRARPFANAYFQHHGNVSILFADIVNFTPLTTSMEVSELVAMLDDLFGEFDKAAEKNHCLRIKILGDCYYCVCGVPNHIPKHAFYSVKMGLAMITTIRKVRDQRQVDVDMRIGINSGDVFSGILGKKKWQYDIWGTDVTIANHMEQAGEKGCVHLTKATKEACGKDLPDHLLRVGKTDAYLEKRGVQTYLLKASEAVLQYINTSHVESHNQWLQPGGTARAKVSRKKSSFYRAATNFQQRVSRQQSTPPSFPSTAVTSITTTNNELSQVSINNNNNNNNASSQPINNNDFVTFSSRRQTAIVDDALEEFRSIFKRVDEYMKEAIEKMPLSKMDQWFNPESVHPLFLTFHEVDMEKPFTLQENPTVKFSIAAASAGFLCMGIVQLLVLRVDTVSVIWASCIPLTLIFTILAWASDLKASTWWCKSNKYSDDDDPENGHQDCERGSNAFQNPNNSRASGGSGGLFGLGSFSYPVQCSGKQPNESWPDYVSRRFVESFKLRSLVFSVIAIASSLVSSLPLYYCQLNQASGSGPVNGTSNALIAVEDQMKYLQLDDSQHEESNTSFLKNLHDDDYRSAYCAHPSYASKSFLLALATTFVFYRGHYLLKLLTMLVNVLIFSIVAVYQRRDMFVQPDSGTDLVDANLHQLILLVVTFHLIDRQTEYLFRLDFVWKQNLTSEKREAEVTSWVNGALLRNILPHHVAEIYLNTAKQQHEEGAPPTHHEVYENVAVMFASIPDFYLDAAQGPESENQKNAYSGTESFAEEVVFQPANKLTLLNQIICSFDELLMGEGDESFEAVEKIKVTGSTYMAAVGLESARKSSQTLIMGGGGGGRASVLGGSSMMASGNLMSPNYRRSRSSEPYHNTSTISRDLYEGDSRESESKAVENAKIMVHFAVKLQEQLKKFNRATFQKFELRIGIDVGPLVAGVIGSKKPMYDIWGDTVNMASRLDYTGVPGKIHVTERVFNRLRAARISAEFRGLTTIKGKAEAMPTYFADPLSLMNTVAEDKRRAKLAALVPPNNYGRSMSTLGTGTGRRFLANFGIGGSSNNSSGSNNGPEQNSNSAGQQQQRPERKTSQVTAPPVIVLSAEMLSEYDILSDEYTTPSPVSVEEQSDQQQQQQSGRHHSKHRFNFLHHSHQQSEGKNEVSRQQPRTGSLPVLMMPALSATAAPVVAGVLAEIEEEEEEDESGQTRMATNNSTLVTRKTDQQNEDDEAPQVAEDYNRVYLEKLQRVQEQQQRKQQEISLINADLPDNVSNNDKYRSLSVPEQPRNRTRRSGAFQEVVVVEVNSPHPVIGVLPDGPPDSTVDEEVSSVVEVIEQERPSSLDMEPAIAGSNDDTQHQVTCLPDIVIDISSNNGTNDGANDSDHENGDEHIISDGGADTVDFSTSQQESHQQSSLPELDIHEQVNSELGAASSALEVDSDEFDEQINEPSSPITGNVSHYGEDFELQTSLETKDSPVDTGTGLASTGEHVDFSEEDQDVSIQGADSLVASSADDGEHVQACRQVSSDGLFPSAVLMEPSPLFVMEQPAEIFAALFNAGEQVPDCVEV